MPVTAKTTDEELRAPVKAAQERLVHQTQSGFNRAEDLAKVLNDLAKEEGRMLVRHALRNALAEKASVNQIRQHLLSFTLNGADDTWSGRANDVRRAHFDGVLAEVREIIGFSDHNLQVLVEQNQEA